MPVLIFFFLNSIRTKRDFPDPHLFSLPGACILPSSWPWQLHHLCCSSWPEVANLWGRCPPLPYPIGSWHSSFKGKPAGGEVPSPNTLPTRHPKREVKAQVPRTHDLQMLCHSSFPTRYCGTPGMFCGTPGMPQGFVRVCFVGEMGGSKRGLSLQPFILPPPRKALLLSLAY